MKKYFIRIGASTITLLLASILNLSPQLFAETVFVPSIPVNDVRSGGGVQIHPSIAVGGDGNIYIAWNDRRDSSEDDIYFAKSIDEGYSFGSNVRVDDTGLLQSAQLSPVIASDLNGNIYAAWADNRSGSAYGYDIYFSKSIDGGISFGTNVRVSDAASTANYKFNPSMAVDANGYIYIVWEEKKGSNYDIYLAKSTDVGNTFGPKIRVDDAPTTYSNQQDPSMTLDADGIIYVVWTDNRVGNYPHIRFSKSVNGGNAFLPSIKVNDGPSVRHAQPSIAVDINKNIYVAWCDERNVHNDYDIYFTKSTDGGYSFSTNLKVDDALNGSQYRPSIAVDAAGNIYIAWDDSRNGNGEIYVTKSTDSGNSFMPNFNVDYKVDASLIQFNPSIAISPNRKIYVVWEQYPIGSEDEDIYFTKGVDGFLLNMAEMSWYQNTAPYSSTGAATCQMILNYIREGAGVSLLAQGEIYEYAKNPLPCDGTELTSDQVDKALGHFDPYDSLVSNGFDEYDSNPEGNPYQGYNYTVDTYDPALDPNAINEYMRDICHWMAYTVTQENWWDDGAPAARPNTPAAIPIYGSYYNWVAVKGCVTSGNPCPQPHTDPWNTPDFTVYGFWMKDPRANGIGQNSYKTAAECQSTYFLPLVTDDAYNGLFLQIAEPPAEMSQADVDIPNPIKDLANLEFIGVGTATKGSGETGPLAAMSLNIASKDTAKPLIRKQSWRDLVDPHLLTDPEAVSAFENTEMSKPVFVDRTDDGSDYYLVPFGKRSKGKFLASAVMILDASAGYFKETSWTDKPEELFKVNEQKALQLVRENITIDMLKELKSLPKKPAKTYLLRQRELLRKHAQLLRNMKGADIVLTWKPDGYSISPYEPYWQIDINGSIWYVTQAKRVIKAD